VLLSSGPGAGDRSNSFLLRAQDPGLRIGL
jgi:hypothetical protein